MKRSIFLLVLLFSLQSFSQQIKEKDVPAAVKNSFYKQFPKASSLKWDKEGTDYEASFKINGQDESVIFNNHGNLLETETAIKTSELPKKALDYLNINYKNKKIKEAAKIVNQKGESTYEAEVNGKDLLFDADGNLIRNEKEG
ncbi:MAG: PepSY-like domain-containing protein [Flavobacterium sp.]